MVVLTVLFNFIPYCIYKVCFRQGFRIRDVDAGSNHSAAVTSSGELYTWGLGEYGRLGHGDNLTQLTHLLACFYKPMLLLLIMACQPIVDCLIENITKTYLTLFIELFLLFLFF